jgi:hypothetical protein
MHWIIIGAVVIVVALVIVGKMVAAVFRSID